MAALLTGNQNIHVRAKASLVNTGLVGLALNYTGLGTEANGEYVRLAQPNIPGARFIPELFKVRHDGSGNFSVPIQFVKTTMVDGVQNVSKFDCTWSRSSTTCTVTTPQPHGFATNQRLAVTNSSSTAAVPNGGTGIITVLSPTTFSFTCTNAGATTGTATIGEQASGQFAVTWSRTTTTMTVTFQGAHGYASNDVLDISAWSDLATLTGGALGTTGVITVTSATQFTFVCLNAGGASGTGTLGHKAGNFVPLTSSVAYTNAAIYTGAGVATVSNGVTGLVPAPVFRKTDELRLLWGVITTVPPTTRLFAIEGFLQTPGG